MPTNQSIEEQLREFEIENERRERMEHRDVLLALGSILKTRQGKEIFKYLFKNFDVGEMPEIGLSPEVLHDRLGFLRAGNSIYKLICEADFEIAGNITAEIERKKYEDKYNRYRIESGLNG